MPPQAVHSQSVTERLADWICSVRAADVPARVLEKARYQTLNVIASLHAGADTEPGKAVRNTVAKWKKTGPCTVIPTGEKMALHEAVLVNAAYAMALDYDDYVYMGHTGHSAVLGSWAICEEEKLPTRDLLLAQVIANEIGGRVGASCVLGPQNGQAWSFIHAIEGAALASRLYGLNKEQTAHALAIAFYQPTFTLWPGFMGPTSKVLTAGGPTVTGIQAAQLAREGLTGAREIFEHPRKGFWASFTYASLPGMLTGLGKSWITDTIANKKYPGCAYIDTSMDALFMILEEFEKKNRRRMVAEDVEKIGVRANLLTVEMDNLSAEHVGEFEKLSPVNINFSIPYNLGIGIIAGKHTAGELSQEFLDKHEPVIRDLAAKTKLTHDWEMSFQVAKAFAGVLGRNSPVAQLSPRQYFKVLRGYQSQMGGKKKNSINLRGLLFDHGTDLARQAAAFVRKGRKSAAKAGGGARHEPDLSEVDFSRFKMAFPSEVTIETARGEKLSARQDIPFGAPGQEKYFETVEEKFRTEAGGALGGGQVDRAIAMMKDLEGSRLEELTKYVCRPGA
ncbi:MAG: MmgE/PrpD family protein [Bdellovibrionota bacterium]